ncbi:thioesterase family protein [Pseudonocardia yuanmonensis]|uniref:Thioesterase family protein n=1 Tax=Pseudonocardia yuanmonensis TaxID=1095914 RepID=A0ABP8VYT5_9PSEU
MARYVAQVPLRWTDQDSYRHLNHARAVTLLEEARIDLMFTAAGAEGVDTFAAGLLVAGLSVEYRRQIPYGAHDLRVEMTVRDVRAASFTIDYVMRAGPAESDPVGIEAETRMALFDLEGQRPRRLTADERAFLLRWAPETASTEAVS